MGQANLQEEAEADNDKERLAEVQVTLTRRRQELEALSPQAQELEITKQVHQTLVALLEMVDWCSRVDAKIQEWDTRLQALDAALDAQLEDTLDESL